MDWTNFAREIGGTYIPGTFVTTPRIEYAYGKWHIVIDEEYDKNRAGPNKSHSRIKAVFSNRRGLTLRIAPRIRIILKKIRIKTSDQEIDDNYIIRCNDKQLATKIYTDENIRKLLLKLSKQMKDPPILYIKVSRFGIGKTLKLKHILRRKSLLVLKTEGLINRKRDLKLLVELFSKVLEKCG